VASSQVVYASCRPSGELTSAVQVAVASSAPSGTKLLGPGNHQGSEPRELTLAAEECFIAGKQNVVFLGPSGRG
jgi:hypothetical protein